MNRVRALASRGSQPSVPHGEGSAVPVSKQLEEGVGRNSRAG